jgi:hypothetical protein
MRVGGVVCVAGGRRLAAGVALKKIEFLPAM